jgi:xanthine dehydrogenase accessory factor
MSLEWLRDGRRVASGLLVEIEGSAPLAPGATMFVDDQGSVEGSISGGCVESAVVQEAEAVLGGEAPRLVVYGVSDELAGTVGLTCGGTLHVFVSELTDDSAAAELAALEAAAEGKPAALVTMIEGDRPGARLAIVGDEVIGSLGSEPLDDRVVADARALLDEGITTLRRYGADGATLGDELAVHVRAFAPPRAMLVFGATDFAAALAPIAKELGYAVTICDARERFVRSPRFTRAADVAIGWPQDVLAERELGPRDVVLVFTHDPKFDEPALLAAVRTRAGYIGALGSRRTTADRNERLRDAGADEADLARIHAPCGLDIGSRTPAETAISVLAEIIATAGGRPGAPLRETSGAIQPRRHETPA